ncbi:MAG: bifunctional oligoribonuclease/PAP phosphatase NrnA [Deltaproteobacteria bacterium]|nr:bifunctional oligoribonuclease/PAP phosphatase NrnA [Deltaproteobacteria bacterium]
MNNLVRVVEVIQDSKHILITSHERPDADAIGSMLALGLALTLFDKEIVYYNKDGVPKVLEFLPGSKSVIKSLANVRGSFDCTIILDCTDASRVGKEFLNFMNGKRCGTSVIVDHHQTTSVTANLYLLNPGFSSTGMIIYSLIKRLRLEINPDIATNLYTTIIGDTGSFRYSNTSPETFRVAAELVEFGANPSEISQALYESDTPERLQLIGLAIPTLEITENGRIASVVLNKEMFNKTCTTSEDSEGIVNYPRSVKGVEVAVLFNELDKINHLESFWKVSLRSKGEVDVAMIAENFCGGGHKRSAGCILKGSLSDVKHRIYSSIIKKLT